jgi:hypothetical protein
MNEDAKPDQAQRHPQRPTEFVSELVSLEQQVGAHVTAALQHEHTVAVLTAVVVGPDGVQRLVSAPLDEQKLAMVRQLLQSANTSQTQEVPCIGFHCRIPAIDQSSDERDDSPSERDDQ